jgi:hypothetical protein
VSCPAIARTFARSASASLVAGIELSGMSTIVVTPPAAAAAVAVANPSHSVRPGSFTCTCVSTTPGSNATSPSSSVTASGAPCGSSDTITPS